ncbi:MAG TPA: NAD(P)-dependent alcohol dehydrogenase [Burkholderiales bacterium]
MKAALYEKYGPPEVVHLRDLPKPEPKDNEVLIKIHATTVTSGDWRVRSLEMPPGFAPLARLGLGITKPRQPILGSELAGTIEAVGKDVTKFKIGDTVIAFSGVRLGCHAEYKTLKETAAIVRKPDNLPFDEAAALAFAGTTALDFFRRGKLKRGEEVLINGASGAVGLAAVQLATLAGAHVTGVCSGANANLVMDHGAHHAMDYTQQDFTQAGDTWDLIVDTAGTAPWSRSKNALREHGRLLQVLGSLGDLLRMPWVAMTSNKRIIAGPAAERLEDLQHLVGLAEKGEFRAVIDRRYPLDRIVEAHRYVDTGRKKGSVVINVLPQA